MEYGYFLACEEHGPSALVEQAKMAEQAGFTSLWISDHFHPWNGAQGQSPFVWSVIGALSQAVSLPVETAVTCPTFRLNPVVTAQAAATSAVMLNGRFRLGVGTGEALNEHVLGAHWPRAAVRLEMLEEAVHVMRLLFGGGQVSHRGKHYTVENARLYTVPDDPVPVDVSAFGPAATELAGRVGDGLVTMSPAAEAVARFKPADPGKPAFGGLKVCWGADREKAIETAHRQWPNEQLPGELPQILPEPRHFEQASELVPREAVEEHVPCGDDADVHIAAIRAYAEAGHDTVHISQMGQDQRGFFDFYRDHVLPCLPR